MDVVRIHSYNIHMILNNILSGADSANNNCEFVAGESGVVRFNFNLSTTSLSANNVGFSGSACNTYMDCENAICSYGICCNSSCNGQV